MGNTKSEDIVSKINVNVFFREFTFSKNDFKALDTNQQLEFADNVVWLDELFFIYQIKDRESNSVNDIKWFDNKVLNKGVKQIKSTLKYISTYPEILIENEKGHKLDITQARKCKRIRKIIIYTPTIDFPEEKRNIKFYESSEVGLIHLFHSEDYYWICKYLLTPSEVDEYLGFREDFYLANEQTCNVLPEQYFLGHFLETLDTDHFNPKYISNLKNEPVEIEKFDISFLIENFTKGITLLKYQTEYYSIIKEISKLNRSELYEFKARFLKAIQKCDQEEIVLPYRIFVPRTNCGFIFIPLHHSKSVFWKTALENFSLAHKYDQKTKKCVGVVVFKSEKENEYVQLYWSFIEGDWIYEEELEKLIANDYPFRKVSTKRIENRYKKNNI